MTSRAVCVGIDDFDDKTLPRLGGCVADATAVGQALSRFAGFDPADVKLVTGARATKDAILRALDWLGLTATAGDRLFLYLATYASELPTERGDELGQVFLVHDHHWQMTVLRDDEILARLRRVPEGVSLAIVVDTGLATTLPTPAGTAGMPPAWGAPQVTRGRFVAPPANLVDAARARGLVSQRRLLRRRPDDPRAVALLAAAPGEVASEIAAASSVSGAFTASFLEVLASAGGAPWEQLAPAIERALAGRGYPQHPQLVVPEGRSGQPAFGGSGQGAPAAPPPGYATGGYAGAPASPGPMGGYTPPAATGGSPGLGAGAIAAASAVGLGGLAAGAAAFFGGGPSSPVGASPTPGMVPVGAPLVPGVPGVPGVAGVPSNAVDTALAGFADGDYSVRVSQAVLSVVPFAPKPLPYHSVAQAVPLLFPQGTAQTAQRAQVIASSDGVRAALAAVGAVDTADAGIAAFSGAKSIWGLVTGQGLASLETDTQQGVDAALKLLAMAYFIYRLYPGSPIERIQMFHTTPAGQAMTIFYAAVDVALPFADNAVSGGAGLLSRVMDRHGTAAASKLASLAGGEVAGQAQGMLGSLLAPVEGIVSSVRPFAGRVADAARQYLPSALDIADKAAGVVASGADALPIYRYLGARAAAEACVLIASRD